MTTLRRKPDPQERDEHPTPFGPERLVSGAGWVPRQQRTPPRSWGDDTGGALGPIERSVPWPEPMPELEWFLALEGSAADGASEPSEARNSWVHWASEAEVLDLYRGALTAGGDPAAPWWVRAMHIGTLASRAEGFALEDEVHDVLSERPGWVFVPWAGNGRSPYWEYTPSDDGRAIQPTTILFGERHPGFVLVLPAHGVTPTAVRPLGGVAGLVERLTEIGSWRV
ncbi:hypothetical protein [Actinoalloteichus spitiensis]|uniref:hypothetical protein n=1 Tax=Actinoalloteichus spitiensis TaxID=252394 RepID=UPI001FDFB068|nr:hypothetical protein [Actinoalloteichus spitiensis]